MMIQHLINREFKRQVALARDANSVDVMIGDVAGYRRAYDFKGEMVGSGESEEEDMSRYVPLIARIENLRLVPANVAAKVIANSRTGTIVVGEDVRISPVAVTHGNLSVQIAETPFVSQPNAFSTQGHTVVGSSSNIAINQSANHAFVFAPGASLKDLVDTINSVGAAPGDLIAILEAIKAAGALHADLEII
jgi:flagellar P-ring protein FlgI